MIIEKIEQLREWLTNSLLPICEADPGALAKYVVALVKKDKPLPELKDSCVDQLDVFLQTKTKPFVETLFEVLDNKSYITKEDDTPLAETTQEVSEIVEPPPVPVPVLETASPGDQQLVTSTSITDIKKEEIKEEITSTDVPKRKSPSPKIRGRDDDRKKRFEDRRPYDRGFQRRRSVSPRFRGRRSRSPYRRRSPFRPLQRSYSPRFRGRERGRSKSWSRSWSRSPKRSFSRSPKRSWSRSRSRDRFRSPGRNRLSKSRSPRREVRQRSRGRSPLRRSLSPRLKSRSPRKRSHGHSKSPLPKSKSASPGARSKSQSRSRSGSPARKVRRQDSDSRGPTPTLENGLADSTNVTPSESTISVVSTGVGRYEESPGRLRCRDFDEKGFCVRGELCPYDHGADPVIVENVPAYPPGPPHGGPPHGGPPHGGPPPHLGHPPPGMGPGGPINMNVPPPGFFPPIGMRPPMRDLPQEPYNPEAPGLTRPGPPPYWPGGPPNRLPPPPFMHRPPPPHLANHIPVKSRLGNRDLVNLTVKQDIKAKPVDEDETENVPTSSTRTVIAPKDDLMPTSLAQPPPPGVSLPETSPLQRPSVGPSKVGFSQQRFHPYHKGEYGQRKPFDKNRLGGFRKPDQSNCTLEVRKVPLELNNIAKINEHFGKFGNLTNIQVKFEGDQEAALITFSTNQEAYSCYKCSEPVFNNRFVKLFWHNKNKTDAAGNQEQSPSSTTMPASQGSHVDTSPLQSRLGPIPHPSKLSLNNMKKPVPSATPSTDEAAGLMPHPERNVVYTTSMGNISKSVYHPVALKPRPQASLDSPTAVKAADFVTRMEKVKQHELLKQEMAQKKLEIQKQKQQLLQKQIEQQKKLIDSLEKCKDMKEESKKTFMEALKTLTISIDKLKTELGGRNVVLKQADPLNPIKSPEQAKKEILDVELELMTKTTSGEDTADLKKKLTDLTAIANSMGLLSAGRGRGRGVARGRGSTTWTAAGITPHPLPVVGRGRGRGMSKSQVMATRTLDRRPKIVEVSGFTAEEKDEVVTHLKALNDVEKVDIPEAGTLCAIVEFKTRKSAELGILHGGKFKTKILKMVWHIPKPDFSRSSSTTSVDTDDHEEIDEEALLAVVEDEEEDGEDNRAWRR